MDENGTETCDLEENRMTLGGTDLNLLVALKVLLEEGNVTRAGRRLEMSQPAMSGALAKLRRKFDDELLVRQGRDFVPTPFALELLPEVQEAVRLISQALRVEEPFDPATSERIFRLTMSDYAMSVLHEPLINQVALLAPHVRIDVTGLGPDIRESDRVLVDHDVLIGPLGYGFPGESRPLWRDRMVCLVDPSNPRLRDGVLTLDDVAALPHAVAEFGRKKRNLTPVDRALGELGVERHVQLTVEGWLPLPFVVEGTDMIAMVPERLARIHARPRGPLVMVEPPFGHVVLAEGYYFSANRLTDPAYQWFFARLDEVAEVLAKDGIPAD
jgi:DNA-binding transcriptional LysR family regulator